MKDSVRALSELATARRLTGDSAGVALSWDTWNAKMKGLKAAGTPWASTAPRQPHRITGAKKEDVHVSPDGTKVHVTDRDANQQHEFTKTKDGGFAHHSGQSVPQQTTAALKSRLAKGDYTQN